MQKQKFYYQDYCPHICAPQERTGDDNLHSLEQKVLNSCRKLLRKETQPGHQLLPLSPAPSRMPSSWFWAISLRDGQCTGTDWVTGCCFSRRRWARALSAPHSAHGTTSHKFSFKYLPFHNWQWCDSKLQWRKPCFSGNILKNRILTKNLKQN